MASAAVQKGEYPISLSSRPLDRNAWAKFFISMEPYVYWALAASIVGVAVVMFQEYRDKGAFPWVLPPLFGMVSYVFVSGTLQRRRLAREANARAGKPIVLEDATES